MSADSVAACVDWTGKRMTDSRPRPEYGEYATPEQQAAAMGRAYVPPPHPESPSAAIGDPPGEETAANPFRPGGNLIDRFVTIFQLGIGFVVLLNSDFFQLSEKTNLLASELGVSQRISSNVDHYAWLLLGANIVLLIATCVWAYVVLRRGRLAFYIPFVGYLAFMAVVGTTIILVR
jgi:hypothetical protein